MKQNNGFSLLEILVAFSILAIALPVLLKIFSAGVNTAFIAEQYTAAVQIAESRMAVVGVEDDLLVGESSGIEDEKFHWRTVVSVINNPVNDTEESSIEYLQVEVVVSWDDSANQTRLLELNSIIAGHKQ
jgi:general secretion pathway protein I